MSTIWVEPNEKPIPEYPLRPSVKAAIAELIARDRAAAVVVEPVEVETAAVVATGTTSQAKPAVATGWDQAFARVRGSAPAELAVVSTRAVGATVIPQPANREEAIASWDAAFEQAHQRRAVDEGIELSEDAEPINIDAAAALAERLLAARSGRR
jgi:hypothetical protein